MKNILFLITIVLLISGCCKDHSDIIPGQDFIPDDVLENIVNNGHPIYEGFDPPALAGCYLMSALELVSSNFEDELFPGHIFSDETLCFTNFNENDLTLDITFEQANTTGEGSGSFVSGSGNDFTIYVKVIITDNSGHELISTKVYSGTLVDGGIENLYLSLFIVDDNGDPANAYIENGQGRLAKDSDGFSPEI